MVRRKKKRTALLWKDWAISEHLHFRRFCYQLRAFCNDQAIQTHSPIIEGQQFRNHRIGLTVPRVLIEDLLTLFLLQFWKLFRIIIILTEQINELRIVDQLCLDREMQVEISSHQYILITHSSGEILPISVLIFILNIGGIILNACNIFL